MTWFVPSDTQVGWLWYWKTEHREREDRRCLATPSKEQFGPMTSRRVRMRPWVHVSVDWQEGHAVVAQAEWTALSWSMMGCWHPPTTLGESWTNEKRTCRWLMEHPHARLLDSILYFTKLSMFLSLLRFASIPDPNATYTRPRRRRRQTFLLNFFCKFNHFFVVFF